MLASQFRVGPWSGGTGVEARVESLNFDDRGALIIIHRTMKTRKAWL